MGYNLDKMKDKEPKLTAKQAKFCQEYMLDFNATQAAIRAGYSKKTAFSIGVENLKKPLIAAQIQNKQDKQALKAELTHEMIIKDLLEVKERCLQHKQVLDREGNPTGEYVFGSKGAIDSLNLLGKHLGMFNEKLSIEHSGEVKMSVNVVKFGGKK